MGNWRCLGHESAPMSPPTVTDLSLWRQAPRGPILLTTLSTTSARQTLGAVGSSIAYDPPFLTHPKRAN